MTTDPAGDLAMFERYTDRAKRAYILADEEARNLGHGTIGTGHLLLGLIREGGGVAFTALDELGVTAGAAREAVLRQRPAGQAPSAGHLPVSPELKKAMELALREALQLSCNYVATEHLLLGLIRQGDGVGALALAGCGGGGYEDETGFPSVVRLKVMQLFHGYAETARERSKTETPPPVLAPGNGARIAALFASWAQKEGILARVTEEQCADLAKAFMYGYAAGAGTEAGDERVAAVLKTES